MCFQHDNAININIDALKATIPTTDPSCDSAKASYNERECRVSTWRGLVSVWKSGLARSIGVSNFNSTNMQDLKDAGLPLPASNQVEYNPGIVKPGNPFVPYVWRHAAILSLSLSRSPTSPPPTLSCVSSFTLIVTLFRLNHINININTTTTTTNNNNNNIRQVPTL